ncbi:LamG domain-containing protein [Actinoplanes sp. TBRC 11911]|uniref:LamG domain-containing protein n=1 Tax=Actinoplanes sp. TBRC 11911 TaxID=2729386 RepID=UPI0020070DD5|nr:LamG domain-containing protein [Actinoplanes sp. TBRC 11911]
MELILSLRQGDGGPVDTSGRGGAVRGRNVAAVEGRLPGRSAMGFDGARSRVVVLPSEALTELGGVRVTTWLWVNEVTGRHTIAEGYLSFALFVDADRSIGGTVYNGFDWGGVRSAPGTVPLRQWLYLAFTYDGVDTSTIHLDNVLRAHEYSPFGSVLGVEWPYGLNVGAWPDADKRVFAGRIDELKLWRRRRTPPGKPG